MTSPDHIASLTAAVAGVILLAGLTGCEDKAAQAPVAAQPRTVTNSTPPPPPPPKMTSVADLMARYGIDERARS